ncbi:uncharacterized protein LOC114522938 [Dendronephthya gigantea]|uniref:uncharacterized protein LOC114522938 n=1 Tax=Dendronephthya gigantea TaxID=151771 RepID=UPI00106CD804|nr:uncharacterized protein LOC114522938 [Dendronephthya gigantea]
MVMTRSTAVGSIVTGSIMLGFAIITVICGAISSSKLSGATAASVGLWALYFAVPGVLTIVAGASKNTIVMGFALFFNIIAVIISTIATIVLIVFTAAMNEVIKYKNRTSYGCHPTDDDRCKCKYGDEYDIRDETYDMKCSDLDTIYSVFIACLVIFIIITITCFAASIFGCMGTCCAPVDPVVVVTTGVPVQSAGGTVVVATNQSSSVQHGYPGGMPPAYGYGQPTQPPAYGDKSGLINNMAI